MHLELVAQPCAALDVMRQSTPSATVLSRAKAWKELTMRAARQIVRQFVSLPSARQDKGIKMFVSA